MIEEKKEERGEKKSVWCVIGGVFVCGVVSRVLSWPDDLPLTAGQYGS